MPLQSPSEETWGGLRVNTLICFCRFSRRMTNVAFVQLFSKPCEYVLHDPQVLIIPTLWALTEEKNPHFKLRGSAERSDPWGRLPSGSVI